MNTVADRIAAVRARIASACDRAGRDPAAVTLVGVTKMHGAAAIMAAHAEGLRDFGENRVQEALPKIEECAAAGVRPVWHLIGHLQSNKVRAAIDAFDILHGIDSEGLARAISERAARPVRIFLEVNAGGETSKFGAAPGEVPSLVRAIQGMRNIDLVGLMTVAPRVDDPEDARPIFRELRALRDATGLRELSMGMTDDFEAAVEEGATHIRVGRAIFGERQA